MITVESAAKHYSAYAALYTRMLTDDPLLWPTVAVIAMSMCNSARVSAALGPTMALHRIRPPQGTGDPLE
jgi:hypothetical protein